MSHLKELASKERKNNIFGERDDVPIRKLLLCGCEAVFRAPTTTENSTISIFARGKNNMYFVCERTIDAATQVVPEVEKEILGNLHAAAELANAVPVYAIWNKLNKKVKFYNLDGKQRKSFD
jgi:hypothetical protein